MAPAGSGGRGGVGCVYVYAHFSCVLVSGSAFMSGGRHLAEGVSTEHPVVV